MLEQLTCARLLVFDTQIEQVCGFALKVTQPDGACAATPAAQAAQAMRPPPAEQDFMFTVTSLPGSAGGPVPVSAAVNGAPQASPPLAVQSATPTAQPVLALAGGVCPVPSPPLLALLLCAGLCRSDADCRAGSACCSNGCGRVCFAAPPL